MYNTLIESPDLFAADDRSGFTIKFKAYGVEVAENKIAGKTIPLSKIENRFLKLIFFRIASGIKDINASAAPAQR